MITTIHERLEYKRYDMKATARRSKTFSGNNPINEGKKV